MPIVCQLSYLTMPTLFWQQNVVSKARVCGANGSRWLVPATSPCAPLATSNWDPNEWRNDRDRYFGACHRRIPCRKSSHWWNTDLRAGVRVAVALRACWRGYGLEEWRRGILYHGFWQMPIYVNKSCLYFRLIQWIKRGLLYSSVNSTPVLLRAKARK